MISKANNNKYSYVPFWMNNNNNILRRKIKFKKHTHTHTPLWAIVDSMCLKSIYNLYAYIYCIYIYLHVTQLYNPGAVTVAVWNHRAYQNNVVIAFDSTKLKSCLFLSVSRLFTNMYFIVISLAEYVCVCASLFHYLSVLVLCLCLSASSNNPDWLPLSHSQYECVWCEWCLPK